MNPVGRRKRPQSAHHRRSRGFTGFRYDRARWSLWVTLSMANTAFRRFDFILQDRLILKRYYQPRDNPALEPLR